MKELLTYIVQSLVDNPEQVSVTERKADGETVYEVRVADGDMGKVIGRQGRIVKQIRILMRAVAQRKGKKSQSRSWTERERPRWFSTPVFCFPRLTSPALYDIVPSSPPPCGAKRWLPHR